MTLSYISFPFFWTDLRYGNTKRFMVTIGGRCQVVFCTN
jgi:hypothetical protein